MQRGETWVGEPPADDVLVDDGRTCLDRPDRRAGGASLLRRVGGGRITAGKPERARRAQIVAIAFEEIDAAGWLMARLAADCARATASLRTRRFSVTSSTIPINSSFPPNSIGVWCKSTSRSCPPRPNIVMLRRPGSAVAVEHKYEPTSSRSRGTIESITSVPTNSSTGRPKNAQAAGLM